MDDCQHVQLSSGVVDSAKLSYRPPNDEQLRKALQVREPARKKVKKSGVTPGQKLHDELLPLTTFPVPVVLPGDELFHDPDYPSQCVQEWIDLGARNAVTRRRRTIYVVSPPASSDDVAYVNEWIAPQIKPSSTSKQTMQPTKVQEHVQPPKLDDVLDYLQASYHGVAVKSFDASKLRFTAWADDEDSKRTQKSGSASNKFQYIGLSTSTEIVRIRCRPSRDGVFAGQLNLNDLLDAAIGMLPSDAYAMIMLVHHDLYEDEDDDFCCGRAYGGSRVAVISTARYRPELDVKQKVDRAHSWPASHCAHYISHFYGAKTLHIPREKRNCKSAAAWHPGSAIATAVMASNALPMPSSASELGALWLGRVCKTAAHELGHCFGIAHCAYRACIMQGTANIAEDARQPPYLCPVDLSKVQRATSADERERYMALLKVCQKWKHDRMFAAFGAWIETRLREMDII